MEKAKEFVEIYKKHGMYPYPDYNEIWNNFNNDPDIKKYIISEIPGFFDYSHTVLRFEPSTKNQEFLNINISQDKSVDLKNQLKILDYYKKNGFSFDTEYISTYEQIRMTALLGEIVIIIKKTSDGDKYWSHIVKDFEKLYKPVKILLLSYFDDEILIKKFNIKSVNRKIDDIYIQCINEIEIELLTKCLPTSMIIL